MKEKSNYLTCVYIYNNREGKGLLLTSPHDSRELSRVNFLNLRRPHSSSSASASVNDLHLQQYSNTELYNRGSFRIRIEIMATGGEVHLVDGSRSCFRWSRELYHSAQHRVDWSEYFLLGILFSLSFRPLPSWQQQETRGHRLARAPFGKWDEALGKILLIFIRRYGKSMNRWCRSV
jgi:hypothetical protein